MQENGMDPLRSVKGTSNRFFTKHFEVDRFLELHEAIELFFESQHNFPDNCYPLDDDEYDLRQSPFNCRNVFDRTQFKDGLNYILFYIS